ncbi:MAG: ABC transporter ATP-binding protein [Actinomycetota bacterium]
MTAVPPPPSPTGPPVAPPTGPPMLADTPPPPPTGAMPTPLPPPRGLAVPPDATVVVREVSKSFGSLVAVSEVSFAVGPGVTAVLGPNGAGKSTLLRVLCGLTKPSRGSVLVAGGNPRTDAGARARIGLVPQQDGVFERDSLYDFVDLAATLTGVQDRPAAVARALAAVELDPALDRPLGAFSKGMRQRAKIAAALVHDPSVLVLDEPLNGLDPKQRRQMIALFHRLGEAGRTVLVSSHVLEEVERFGTNVLVLAKGRLAAEGDFRAIRALMNDQPLTYRVGCSDPRRVAAELLREGLITSCTVTGDRTAEITTVDAITFRRRLPAICRAGEVRLEELSPLDADLESVFRYLVGP